MFKSPNERVAAFLQASRSILVVSIVGAVSAAVVFLFAFVFRAC